MAFTPDRGRTVQAGRLREPIKIQHAVTTQDASGTPQADWQDLIGNLWSEKLDVAGQEKVRGVQIEAGVSHVFEVRSRSGITPEMRVITKVDGVAHNIVAVLDRDGRRRKLWLMCERIG